MYLIEKNLPIPAQTKGARGASRFPTLEIGDSFLASIKERATVYCGLTKTRKYKVTSRAVGKEHVRFWRIA